LKRLHGKGEEVDLKPVSVEGNGVCLWYDLVTNSPAGTAMAAEWHPVEGDNVRSIQVLFDARPFAPLFARARKG
jgi:hypothetical protein